MEYAPRLEVLVFIPLGRTSKKTKIMAFVNDKARKLDEDELALFSSGAYEVSDKAFNEYKKFSDKSYIQAKGNVNKDPIFRIISYRSTKSLITK